MVGSLIAFMMGFVLEMLNMYFLKLSNL